MPFCLKICAAWPGTHRPQSHAMQAGCAMTSRTCSDMAWSGSGYGIAIYPHGVVDDAVWVHAWVRMRVHASILPLTLSRMRSVAETPSSNPLSSARSCAASGAGAPGSSDSALGGTAAAARSRLSATSRMLFTNPCNRNATYKSSHCQHCTRKVELSRHRMKWLRALFWQQCMLRQVAERWCIPGWRTSLPRPDHVLTAYARSLSLLGRA